VFHVSQKFRGNSEMVLTADGGVSARRYWRSRRCNPIIDSWRCAIEIRAGKRACRDSRLVNRIMMYSLRTRGNSRLRAFETKSVGKQHKSKDRTPSPPGVAPRSSSACRLLTLSLITQKQKSRDYYRPRSADGRLCVCVRVCACVFEQNDIRCRCVGRS